MGITLAKGQGLTLEKSQNNLSLVTIGLGWDIAEQKKGLLGGLFGGQPAEYDLDVVAFLCDASGKVRDVGRDASGGRAHVLGRLLATAVIAAFGDALAQILDTELSLIEMDRCASRNIVDICMMDAGKLQQLAAYSLRAQARYEPSDFNVDRLHGCSSCSLCSWSQRASRPESRQSCENSKTISRSGAMTLCFLPA